MEADFGDVIFDLDHDVERLKAVTHPDIVRDRRLSFVTTKFYRNFINVRGSFTHIATIGQTFHEMIDSPDFCGGMLHVMEVWREHGGNFLDEIIEVIGSSEKPILKVRAGYLLEGVLGIDDLRVQEWLAYVQRGSSCVLDSGKPLSPIFSENECFRSMLDAVPVEKTIQVNIEDWTDWAKADSVAYVERQATEVFLAALAMTPRFSRESLSGR